MATPTNLPAAEVAYTELAASWLNDLRGAFRILQVVSASNGTLEASSTTTFADTSLTVSITPQSTSSKILIFAVGTGATTAGAQGLSYRLNRGATVLRTANNIIYDGSTGTQANWTFLYLDSPATTSKLQFARGVGAGTVYQNPDSNTSDIVVCEVSA
jgi:hypothetical protein